jgi:hypothetical protein
MNKLISKIKSDTKKNQIYLSHIKGFQLYTSLIENLEKNIHVFNNSPISYNSYISKLINEFVLDFDKFTNLTTKVKRGKLHPDYTTIPYHVILYIFEFYLINYEQIYKETFYNYKLFNSNTTLRILIQFINEVRNIKPESGKFRFHKYHEPKPPPVTGFSYSEKIYFKPRRDKLSRFIKEKYNKYKYIMDLTNYYILKPKRDIKYITFLENEINKIIRNVNKVNYITYLYGFFEKDRTRKIFNVFRYIKLDEFIPFKINLFDQKTIIQSIGPNVYRQEPFKDYLLIPNDVKYLDVEDVNYEPSWNKYNFSRFKKLITFINYKGSKKEINNLVMELKKLKNLAVDYILDDIDEVIIFKNMPINTKIERAHINITTPTYDFTTIKIIFMDEFLKNLKSFDYYVYPIIEYLYTPEIKDVFMTIENKKMKIQSSIFDKLINCISINLYSMSLRTVHIKQLNGLPKLKRLHLSYCELREVDEFENTALNKIFSMKNIKVLEIIRKQNMLMSEDELTIFTNIIYDLQDIKIKYLKIDQLRNFVNDFNQKKFFDDFFNALRKQMTVSFWDVVPEFTYENLRIQELRPTLDL